MTSYVFDNSCYCFNDIGLESEMVFCHANTPAPEILNICFIFGYPAYCGTMPENSEWKAAEAATFWEGYLVNVCIVNQISWQLKMTIVNRMLLVFCLQPHRYRVHMVPSHFLTNTDWHCYLTRGRDVTHEVLCPANQVLCCTRQRGARSLQFADDILQLNRYAVYWLHSMHTYTYWLMLLITFKWCLLYMTE